MKNQKILSILFAGTIALSSIAISSCGAADSSSKYESETVTTIETTTVIETTKATERPTTTPKKLSLPFSSEEAKKKNYHDLYEELIDKGFSNVDYEKLYDLSSRKDKQNELVSSVTIDGKDSFKKNDKVLYNARIVINYHSVKWLDTPIIVNDIEYEDMNYKDVVAKFKKAGFTNVSSKESKDTSKPSGTVIGISIDGDSSDCIAAPVDASIVITYCTKKPDDPKPTKSSSKYEKAFVRHMSNYDLYYLFDTDEKTAISFSSDGSIDEEKYSGDFNSGVELSMKSSGDYLGKFKHKNGSTTAYYIDGSGYEWEYSVCDISTAENMLNKIK